MTRILLIFVIVFFAACEKDILVVTLHELEFAADATEEQFLNVTAYRNSWRASTNYDWIIINKESNILSVSVEKHTEINSSRTGNIIVRAGNATPVVVTVTQFAAAPNTLLVDPAYISFAANETFARTVAITTNAESWNATVSAQWLTIEKQEDVLVITPKAINSGLLQLSAEIIITAGNAKPLTVPVTQETFGSYINFDTAIGAYHGNKLNTGTAWFFLELYNNSDPDVGIIIEGFSTLPSSADDFMLDEGIYFVGNGAVMTFMPGNLFNGVLYPTFFHCYNTNNYKLVNGGTFTVSLSDAVYTITTNFTARDLATGDDVDNIRLRYTGRITFIDREQQ